MLSLAMPKCKLRILGTMEATTQNRGHGRVAHIVVVVPPLVLLVG